MGRTIELMNRGLTSEERKNLIESRNLFLWIGIYRFISMDIGDYISEEFERYGLEKGNYDFEIVDYNMDTLYIKAYDMFE